MTQIRRGAFWLYRLLLPLYVLGVVVAFFLGGAGAFFATDNYDAHSAAGLIVAMEGSLLLLLLALVSWRDRVTVGATFLLAILGFLVQPALAEFDSWAGAFHPVNGLVILGLSSWLAHRSWRGRRELPRAEATPPAAQTSAS